MERGGVTPAPSPPHPPRRLRDAAPPPDRTDRDTAWLIRPAGLVPYADAYDWMHTMAERRFRGEIPDTLILLEHPPVYTAGKRWDPSHLVWAEEAMRAAGAEFHLVDRGGSVTFHGPGQLVGYPLVDLGPGRDVVGYVRRLEEVIIRAGEDAGLTGLSRNPANSGVWAGDRKVCAIGVRVARARVTLHGFALNCTTDLSWYEAIVPCGLTDHGVTSLSEVAGRTVTVEEMIPRVIHHFESAFGRALQPGPDLGP
ncbi:MAG: lipoyl(octanoyl) transferase LipB [Actinomycetota bacterium]